MMRAMPVAAIIVGLTLSASAWAAPCDGFVDVDVANGFASFAAGYRAAALAPGEFVWADKSGSVFEPSIAGSPAHGWTDATNTFNVRATGGVWFVTGLLADGQPGTGPYVVPGSGA